MARIAAATLLGAGVLALTACGGSDDAAAEAASGEHQAPAAKSVEVMYAAAQTVANTQQLPGRVRASREAEIRPQVTGLIEERLFTEGETVEKGQALYQIDKAEYAAAYASAKASLARAEANALAAKETMQRYERLADINAVSQQDYDNALASLKAAEADVGMNTAALRTAWINLERTTVTSPISGRIGRSSVTPGALVTQNQATTLARVVQLDPVYVDLTASSTQMLNWRQAVNDGRIQTGENGAVTVSVILENGETYPHLGELEFTEVSVEESTGSVVLRAKVANPDGLLLPGMFVKTAIRAGEYKSVFLLPQAVVSRTPRGDAIVYVVNDENKVETRTLTLAQAIENKWVVTAGLQEGDAIVVSGMQSIKEGMSVTPKQVDAERLATLQQG